MIAHRPPRRRSSPGIEPLEGRALLATSPAAVNQILVEPLEGRALLATTSPAAVNRVLVEIDYLDILGRAPDAPGLAVWSDLLDNGASPTAVARRIAGGREALTRDVERIYIKDLERPPSPAELAAGVADLRALGGGAALAADLIGSGEAARRLALGGTSAFLDYAYEQALGRYPDAAGEAAYRRLLADGAGRVRVAYDLLTSPEAAAREVTGLYQQVFGRAPDAPGLAYWVSQSSSTDGHAPAISSNTLLADFLGSPENVDQARGIYPNPGATSLAFEVMPYSLVLNAIAPGGNRTSVGDFTVFNLDASRPLIFTPEAQTVAIPASIALLPGGGFEYAAFLPLKDITVLDASGRAIAGPVVVAPGGSATLAVRVDSSSLPAPGPNVVAYDAAIDLIGPDGQPLASRLGPPPEIAIDLTLKAAGTVAL